MQFGERLRDLRMAGGFRSQQALADALGVAQSTVANWERGRREPNYETTLRLTQLFEVSTDYLLGLSDDPRVGAVSQAQLWNALFGEDADLPPADRAELWEDVREYAHYKLQQYGRRR